MNKRKATNKFAYIKQHLIITISDAKFIFEEKENISLTDLTTSA